jgi:hypothetical protein
MAETVELTRAVVTAWNKNDSNPLREFKTEKGGIVFSFKVETRVNDRVENSPRLFRRCAYFSKTEEEASKTRKLITKGATVELRGLTNRKSFKDKETGAPVYYDEIDVKSLSALQTGQDANSDTQTLNQDLPF